MATKTSRIIIILEVFIGIGNYYFIVCSKRGSAPTILLILVIILSLAPRNVAGFGIDPEVIMNKPIEKTPVYNSNISIDKKTVKPHKGMLEPTLASACKDSETPVNAPVYGPQAVNSASQKS